MEEDDAAEQTQKWIAEDLSLGGASCTGYQRGWLSTIPERSHTVSEEIVKVGAHLVWLTPGSTPFPSGGRRGREELQQPVALDTPA